MIKNEIKKYKIMPSDGEALLNYKGRLSADDLFMQLYEIDEKSGELINTDNNSNLDGEIFDGDCLSVCAYLKDQNKKVDFIYIDPPFASNANYSKKINLKNKVKKKSNYNADVCETTVGEEIMYGDIWTKEDYLNWIYTRLVAMREILDENGSIMVQLDWHIGHYVKVLLDEVFGEENFRNEIIWSYRSGGASKKESLAKKHDVIYYYSKNTDYEINQLLERQYLEKPFMDSKQDEEGRYYVDTILRDVLEGIINIVEKDGTITQYNVRPVLNLSAERTDYNTQKPEGLIKLLIRIATNEDAVVADFFGGSGSTAISAYKSNRKFITCDIGKNAIQIIRDRLKSENAKCEIINIKDGLDLFRNPTQTMNKLFSLCFGEKRDNDSEYSNFWDGIIPFNKKMLYTKIIDNSKILDEPYLDYIITQISQDNVMDKQDEYLLLYIYKDNNINQNILDKKINESGMNYRINLISIEEILKEKINKVTLKDSANISIKKSKNKYIVKIENYFSPYLKNKIDEENQRRKSGKKLKISENGYELIELVAFDTTLKDKWISYKEELVDQKSQTSGTFELNTNKFKMKIRNIAGDEIIISSEDIENE